MEQAQRELDEVQQRVLVTETVDRQALTGAPRPHTPATKAANRRGLLAVGCMTGAAGTA